MRWLVRDNEGLVHIAYDAGKPKVMTLCDEFIKNKSYMASDAVTCLECIAREKEPTPGGHAVLAIGQKSDGALIFQNSWGKTW